MLDLFRDGFCICGGPFGSGMWKNWKVAALKYFRPVTYMACVCMQQSELERDTFNFETFPSFWYIYCEFHCDNQRHCIQLSAQVRSNAHGKDKEFGHGRDAGLRHEKRKTRAPQVS